LLTAYAGFGRRRSSRVSNLDQIALSLAATFRHGPPLAFRGSKRIQENEIVDKDRVLDAAKPAELETPGDIADDGKLSHEEKKTALETLELDAHQLLTASNEGMALVDAHAGKDEVQLADVVKAKATIGEKPTHKPSQ
jgi:hypothetical protein